MDGSLVRQLRNQSTRKQRPSLGRSFRVTSSLQQVDELDAIT